MICIGKWPIILQLEVPNASFTSTCVARVHRPSRVSTRRQSHHDVIKGNLSPKYYLGYSQLWFGGKWSPESIFAEMEKLRRERDEARRELEDERAKTNHNSRL